MRSCLTGCDGSCCTQRKSVRAGLIELGLQMYRSEGHFSRAICNMLFDKIMYRRIESGETSVGIPDLWLRFPEREVWVELKNCNRLSINDKRWEIPWRKGQQSFAVEYMKATGQHTYTAVAMNDGYVVIPMHKRYTKNIVFADDTYRMTRLKDIYIILESEVRK